MSAPRIFAPEYYARMRELEAGSWWNAAMRDGAARLLTGAGLPDHGLMLDVGCGSGQTMAWFRERWPRWRTIGFDVARDGLRAAHEAGGERVFGASALTIPLPTAAVDAVVTIDVVQHLPLGGGDGVALAEMRRVLRPGGLLFVRTNAQAFPRIPDDPRHNFHKYAAPELRERLERAGFAVHRLGRVNTLLGLAEIPRELRARRPGGDSYAGLLAQLPRRGVAWHAKRAWLRWECGLVAAGWSLPMGRTLLAVARAVAASAVA